MTSLTATASEPIAASRSSPALCSIAGIGYFLPQGILTNDDLALTLDTSDEWIVERTGIHARHTAAKDEATSDLATRAARNALADAGVAPLDLDLILLATSTPDSPVPATSCLLQRNLGADVAGIPAMDISAGCSGFGYAVQVAAAAVKSGMHRRVLVVGADCLTRITNYKDRQSCVLFGDGAGAAVITAEGNPDSFIDVLYSDIGANGADADLIRVPAGGSRLPASTGSVASAGHTMALRGREVFKAAVRQMTLCIERAAERTGLGLDGLDLVIPHQANARIIEAVGGQLGLPADRVVIDIAETGNMAAASIPVALGRARESGRLKSGQIVAVVGFGAGLTWACQVLRIRDRAANWR